MTFDAHKIGQCTIETTNKMVDGFMVRYHVIRTERNAPFSGFIWDDGLVGDDVVLEPGSLLISQSETEKKLSRPAGVLPEKWLDGSMDAISVCPNNFWYAGAFVISSHGFVVPFGNFRVRGKQEAIVLVGNKWQARRYDFDRRVSDENVRVGFGMPLILEDGRIRPLDAFADDLRVTSDTRNFADYAFGRTGLPGDFWLLLRRVMPGSGEGLLAVLRGGEWTETRDDSAMSLAEFARFQAIIESQGLSDNLRLGRGDNQIRFTIVGQTPVQRIPVVGVGFDESQQLIVVVVEGRQPHSVGVSSTQLAQIMLNEGAITAGLGSAGGDAYVPAMVRGKFTMLSAGKPRPAPCMLLLG